MDRTGKNIGAWKEILGAMRSVAMYALLSVILMAGWVSVADAYVVSGTVTNSSGKPGRTYLFVNNSEGYGTSIASAGTFTISGVPSGTYIITAVMDTRGDGRLFATDPVGVSTSFTVASGDKNGVAITLTNPTVPTPPTPSWLKVYPGDGSAVLMWEIIANYDPYLPIADHYNLYWSTSASVSPTSTSGGGSRLGIPHPRYAPFFMTGLTNGATFYFVITAVVKGGVEGAPSPVYGPVTIGPPSTAGVTVQGNVIMSGFTPTGPLCIILFGGDTFPMKCFSSPTTSQSFQFNNVPDGYYGAYAFVDMNNNGVQDPGDITDELGIGGSPFLVQGAPVSGVTVTLTNSGGKAVVRTEYVYPSSYTVFFESVYNSKMITNMTVLSGPNLAQPIDVPWDDGWFDTWNYQLPGRPNIGDTYSINLRYSDSTTDTLSSAITDILDGYSTPISPSGGISGLMPLMTWSQPSSPPSQVPFSYSIHVYNASGTRIWDYQFSNNRTYAVYNEDGTATPLVSGSQYHWYIEIKDQQGNRGTGPTVYFTPTTMEAKQLAVVSRNPASGVAIAVNMNGLNGDGNGSSPFIRKYDPGTTVVLTAPATAGGNHFSYWSGCDSVIGTQCTVTMTEDKMVNAIYRFRAPAPAKIGVFQNGYWYLDANQSWAWDGTPTDILGVFGVGLTGAVPVVGDWNGDGKTKIGVFIDGVWYLDMNNNWQWDGEGVDVRGVFGIGIPNAIPVVGDWNGDGKTKIGIYADGVWYLDVNGNWQWDGEPTDVRGVFGVGLPNAIPVTGDWNGDGKTEIGIYSNGNWYLDKNANWQWDGTPIDTFGVFGVGLPNVQPVTGDWNGNGITKIGVYSEGNWYLDTNASWQWDGTPTDTYGLFGVGLGPVTPVTGNW